MTPQLWHVAIHDSFIFNLHAKINHTEFEEKNLDNSHENVKDFLSENN